ncbi:hypothetical protein [Streptomyces murinus]|nr:hypothetical protein [Streptomyces murinus]
MPEPWNAWRTGKGGGLITYTFRRAGSFSKARKPALPSLILGFAGRMPS